MANLVLATFVWVAFREDVNDPSRRAANGGSSTGATPKSKAVGAPAEDKKGK